MPETTREKIRSFITSKYGEAIIFTFISALSLLFTIIFYSIKLTPINVDENGSILTLWSATVITNEQFRLRGVNVFLLIAFFTELGLVIAAGLLCFLKRNKVLYLAAAAFSFALDIAILIIHFIFGMLQPAALVFMVFNMLTNSAVLAYLIILRKRKRVEGLLQQETEDDEQTEYYDDDTAEVKRVSQKTLNLCRTVMLICEIIATVAMFTTLFTPIYTAVDSFGTSTSYSLIQTFTQASMPIYFHIAFLAVFIGCIAGLLSFVSSVAYFKSKRFGQKSKTYVYGVTFFTLAFFAAGYVVTFILNLSGENSANKNSTVSYIPFIISLISLLAHSIAMGKSGTEDSRGIKVKSSALKAEPLIYVLLMTVGLYASLLLNVVSIKTQMGSFNVQDVNLSGYKLLTEYSALAGGFQLVAFLIFSMLLASSVMLLMSFFSLVAKNKDYYKIVKTAAFTDLAFALLIGLFGVYFKIAQQINEENILSLLEMFGFGNVIDYTYELSSQTLFVLVICGILFAVMLFRRQFNLAVEQTEMEVTLKNPQDESAAAAATSANQNAADGYSLQDEAANFDACPAFTELDGKIPQLNAELEAKRFQLFENFTLPNLVRFVVDYARESRLHLSYSLEDMATFVAGLGASRLTILQGMSGTGKTSLPKIFTEAVLGVCEIVEVESSWRDKNELLGYYNEFSKCFTPKKFTQCLYKARLNSSVLTLIVLDEMNLSRIEYYFSDFLSLMENEPDKREIKLLNIKLYRNEDGETIPYRGLTDGHTIKIPQNVWFIGTANRDESTFAISDKVYDRAQTMNFNKRAPKINSFSQPLNQKFVSYDMLIDLFEQAKISYSFDAESNTTVQKTEKLLAPYNISFGNRILKQMEDFVKIYCACFGDKDAVVKDAVEKILLSKVVSKLENKVVENKESLADEFDRLGLTACSAFVRKLNED